jgi:hypothetical protein
MSKKKNYKMEFDNPADGHQVVLDMENGIVWYPVDNLVYYHKLKPKKVKKYIKKHPECTKKIKTKVINKYEPIMVGKADKKSMLFIEQEAVFKILQKAAFKPNKWLTKVEFEDNSNQLKTSTTVEESTKVTTTTTEA